LIETEGRRVDLLGQHLSTLHSLTSEIQNFYIYENVPASLLFLFHSPEVAGILVGFYSTILDLV
jgi:hypothetical protein